MTEKYKMIGDMREQKIINVETGDSYCFTEIVRLLNKQDKEINELKRVM